MTRWLNGAEVPTHLACGSDRVTFELLLPVFLWIPKARPAAILVGTLFHLGIAFSMDIHVFSYSIIASYLLFLDPKTLPEMVRTRLVRKTRSSKSQRIETPRQGSKAQPSLIP